jgi:hypothetical protein
MDTAFLRTMMTYFELFCQYFPPPHWAYVRGDVWALTMSGTTRKCMTNIVCMCVFVDRHLARGKRIVAQALWDWRGVRQWLVPRPGASVGRPVAMLRALWAAVDTPRPLSPPALTAASPSHSASSVCGG